MLFCFYPSTSNNAAKSYASSGPLLYAVQDYSSSCRIFMILFFSLRLRLRRGVLVCGRIAASWVLYSLSILMSCRSNSALHTAPDLLHKHCSAYLLTLQLVTTVLSAAKHGGFLLSGRIAVTVFQSGFPMWRFYTSARHRPSIWSFPKFIQGQTTQPVFKLLFTPFPDSISLEFPATFNVLFGPEVNVFGLGDGARVWKIGYRPRRPWDTKML